MAAKKSACGIPRKPMLRTKKMLLPLDAASVCQLSLEYHLALEVLRSVSAEEHHLCGIAHAICIARYVHQAGYGWARDAVFQEAEDAFLRCQALATETGNWAVDHDAFRLFAEILALHDRQLTRAPAHEVIRAYDRLIK